MTPRERELLERVGLIKPQKSVTVSIRKQTWSRRIFLLGDPVSLLGREVVGPFVKYAGRVFVRATVFGNIPSGFLYFFPGSKALYFEVTDEMARELTEREAP